MDIIDKYVLTLSTDRVGRIIKVSSAFLDLTGYSRKELLGKKPSIFKSSQISSNVYKELWSKVSSGIVWSGELENLTKDRKHFWVETTILPNYNKDGILSGYTAISHDVSDKKLLEYTSEHDKLTQLFNRVKLDNVLIDNIGLFVRYKRTFSILLIDIDHFKSVNDNFGHQAGDSVLIEVANIISKDIRKTDIAGRWGGEEFMIITPETALNGATQLAEKIRREMENYRFKFVGHKTASFGVTEFREYDTIETLIQRADTNLYKAKNSGRNRVVST